MHFEADVTFVFLVQGSDRRDISIPKRSVGVCDVVGWLSEPLDDFFDRYFGAKPPDLVFRREPGGLVRPGDKHEPKRNY